VGHGVLTRLWLLLVVLSVACAARRDNSHINLEPPTDQTTLGPGDVFQLQIVGEKDLPLEYQVASDGTVNLPFVHQVKVAGLEPQQVERLVAERLVELQVLSDPSVVVTVKEYASKRISVLGQVQKPGSFPFTSGMTLIQVISLAGGLTAIAEADRVNLTRHSKTGSRTVVLSIEAITEGRSPDIPLQAGDQIFVHERIF
jgi:polysaccharide export outer membrane protein